VAILRDIILHSLFQSDGPGGGGGEGKGGPKYSVVVSPPQNEFYENRKGVPTSGGAGSTKRGGFERVVVFVDADAVVTDFGRTFEYDTLRYTATHCDALQHTATYCNTLQRTAT